MAITPERTPETALAGFCPMGCGQTLYRSRGGMIFCGSGDCPDVSAVHRILDDPETEHRVQVGQLGWTIRHPLRERIGDGLILCSLVQHMRAYGSRLPAPGDYRAIAGVRTWRLIEVP